MLSRLSQMLRGGVETETAPEPAPYVQPETDWPNTVQLETTGVCNLRCTMCPTTYYPSHRNLRDEVFEGYLGAAPHVQNIVLSYGGEPLLYGKFFKVVERLREVAPDCHISFNSNATYFTEEACEKLVGFRVNEIVVSMDGATAETYNKIRVRSDFDKVVENIRRLVRARGSAPLPVLGFLLVAAKNNVHEMAQLVELAHTLGLQKVMINGLEPYEEANRFMATYSERPDPSIARHFEEAEALAKRHGIEFQMPSLIATRERKYCPALTVCLIDGDGEVYPCWQYSTDIPFYYHGELTKHKGPLSFGNIAERPLYDIWNSPEYRKFRDDLRDHRFYPECRQCLLAEGVTCNVKIYPI